VRLMDVRVANNETYPFRSVFLSNRFRDMSQNSVTDAWQCRSPVSAVAAAARRPWPPRDCAGCWRGVLWSSTERRCPHRGHARASIHVAARPRPPDKVATGLSAAYPYLKARHPGRSRLSAQRRTRHSRSSVTARPIAGSASLIRPMSTSRSPPPIWRNTLGVRPIGLLEISGDGKAGGDHAAN